MKEISRRGFLTASAKGTAALSYLWTLSAASIMTLISSCSNIVNDIKNWVPVGIAAFSSIVNLLQSAGVINPIEGSAIAALISIVKAGFAQVLSDISQYQSITPPPVGALQKIKDGLEIIVTNIQTFLNTINISNNPIIALVTGLVSIILSTISAFQGQLPASVAARPVAEFHLSGKTIVIVPIKRTRKQFISDFDAACVSAGHPEVEIH